jgi:hypothetical protein
MFQPPLASRRMRPDRRAHGPDSGDVVGERLPALGDLDLDRAAAVVAGEHLGDAVGVDGGHRRVDGDAVAAQHELVGGAGADVGPAEVEGGGQPGRGLGVVVLGEGRELGPAGRAAQQQRLAHVDAAEAGRERQRHDPRHAEQLVERRERERRGERGGPGLHGIGHASQCATRIPAHDAPRAWRSASRSGGWPEMHGRSGVSRAFVATLGGVNGCARREGR